MAHRRDKPREGMGGERVFLDGGEQAVARPVGVLAWEGGGP